MPQVVFEKAVEKYLPTATPVSLKRIDEYSVGKVLVYSKKPRKQIPLHELDFTGFSLQSLLLEGENFSIATERSFLFNTDKSTITKAVKVDLSADIDLNNANTITKLLLAKVDLNVKGGESKNLTISTDFGKITHISTDLVTSIARGTLKANPDHAIVKKAVSHGGVMFVVTDIYEAEKCSISVSLSEDITEGAGGNVTVAKEGTKDSENVDDKHTSTSVVTRDQPTPLAYLLMTVTVDSKGKISTQLDTQLSGKLHVRMAGTVIHDWHYGLLMKQLVSCQAHWERIATGLRFHPHEIENITASHVHPEPCLRAVLSQWLNWAEGDARGSEGVATLEALKTALDRAGFPKVANSLTLDESWESNRRVNTSDAEFLSRSELGFCANIEKHMRSSGIIDRFLAHLVFVGFPASGKTTLIYRLLNLAINIEASSSTGVMDGVITVNIGEDKASMHAANVDEKMEKCLWHKVEFSLSCLRQMGMLSSQLSRTPSHVSQHRAATDPAMSHHDPATDHDPDHGPATDDSQPMKVVLTTIQKTLQEKGYSADGFREILPYLSNKTTLYLSDTGGQVEFQELLPLLVAGCAIFLFLFPLNKDLDQPVHVSYRKKGGGESNAYISSLTIEESFLQTLSSIDSMRTDDPSMKRSAHLQHDSSMKHSSDFKHKPAVFVIGTHKDCLIKELGKAQAKKKIKTVEERIKELVKKHRYGELVVHADPAKEKILFAVSNVDKNDKKFQRIRSRIMTLIRKEDRFHIEFPLSYLLASMQLDGKNVPFVKRFDFAKDVLQYGIKEEDIDHLLRFLHTRIGQIRYFPLEEIREDIVREPQVLYDIVTHLITESFLLPGNVAQASEVKRGVYSVESFSKHTAVLETSRLIALLRELRIVAPFFDQKSKKQKLFIPCVLNHLENPAGSDGCETSMVQPLALIFERGHCPKGMFGVLLHYIITQHSKDWNLDIQTIFRDQVSFQVCPYNDVVTIKFHTAYLEVRYFPDRVAQRGSASTEKKICNKIHSVLASGIKQATTSLHYSPERTKFNFGLVCTECNLAHTVTEGYTIKCPKQASSALPNPGSFWFKIPTYSFSEQLEEGGRVFLKKGSNPPKQFSVSSESSCSQHALTKIKGHTHRIDHVYLEQNTIIFEDILECDEGVYRVSSHNDVGSGQMLFELNLKCPTKYKFLQRYLKGVAGSSSTLEFSVDPPVPEDTEHFLRKENGEAAPPWFEIKHDCIIFQDIEEGDKGKYIISCRDTEGELVEETLWLKVMPSQPSALAAHGAASLPGQGVQPLREQQQPAASRTVVKPCHYSCLMRQLSPYAWEWESIAEGLDFHLDEIKSIKAEPEKITEGNKFCLRSMLSQWIKWAKGDARGSKDRATLEALKEAVSGAGHLQVANELSLTD